MGKIILMSGICCVALGILTFFIYLGISKGTVKRLKKELDEEYKGYKR